MKIAYLIQLFLDSRRRGTGGAKRRCRPATYEIYQRNLKLFEGYMAESQGLLQYDEIRRLHVSEFLDWIETKEKSKAWSRGTALQLLRCVKTFFIFVDNDEDCKEAGLRGYNKWLPVTERAPRRTDIPQTVDLKQFKDSFNTKNVWQFRDYVVTCMMLSTGVRIGEVCNLELDSVFLDQHFMVVDGKTGKRPVPLTIDMMKLLRAWYRRRESCPTAKDSRFVFVSKYRDRMDSHGFGQRFRKHTKKYNLPRITAHTMRHSFCTHFLKKGGDMEKLRSITGHATYEMLKDYLHLAKLGGESIRHEMERTSILKDL